MQNNFFVLFFQTDDISIIYGIWDKQTSGSWFNLYYALFIALYIRCLVTTWIDIPTCLCGKEEGVGGMLLNIWRQRFDFINLFRKPGVSDKTYPLTSRLGVKVDWTGLDRNGLCKHALDWTGFVKHEWRDWLGWTSSVRRCNFCSWSQRKRNTNHNVEQAFYWRVGEGGSESSCPVLIPLSPLPLK